MPVLRDLQHDVGKVFILDIIKVILLGIVEGLTEFLPVSSTGHLILVERQLTLSGSPGFTETFMIVIQLPAILAVVLYFWPRLWPFHRKADTINTCVLWVKVGVAFLPAAVLGLLFDDQIEAWFFNPTSVAIALILGGLALLALERAMIYPRFEEVAEIGIAAALCIGLFQCLAMMPGTLQPSPKRVGMMAYPCRPRRCIRLSRNTARRGR